LCYVSIAIDSVDEAAWGIEWLGGARRRRATGGTAHQPVDTAKTSSAAFVTWVIEGLG
jgi:hypothetical protein